MLRRVLHSKREENSSDLRLISVRLQSPPTHKKLSSMVLIFLNYHLELLNTININYEVLLKRSLIQYFNIYVHFFNTMIDQITLMKLDLFS